MTSLSDVAIVGAGAANGAGDCGCGKDLAVTLESPPNSFYDPASILILPEAFSTTDGNHPGKQGAVSGGEPIF